MRQVGVGQGLEVGESLTGKFLLATRFTNSTSCLLLVSLKVRV